MQKKAMAMKQKALALRKKNSVANQLLVLLKTSLEVCLGHEIFNFNFREKISRKMQVVHAIMVAAIGLDYGNITPALLSQVAGWHGTIIAQMGCIRTLLDGLVERQSTLSVPNDYITLLTTNLAKLDKLSAKRAKGEITAKELRSRNTTLKLTVAYSLHTIRIWVFGQHADGTLSTDDVHDLGFLLPGEMAGYRGKSDPTDAVAEAKPLIITANMMRVIIDQATVKNAGPVMHGWPHGIRMAILLILADDGETEILRLMTTRLHTDIEMPADCHGKQYIVKAAFLKHVNDTPRWSAGAQFSMPKDTTDLAHALDQQHYEEYEASLRTVEQHHQEIKRLHAELAEAHAKLGGEAPAN
jgi:hypothetical protein